MLPEKRSLTADALHQFNALQANLYAEDMFPTRNNSNNKLEVTELFTYFTANIIKEDVEFTR